MKIFVFVLAAGLLTGCASKPPGTDTRAAQAGPQRLGKHSFKVTTTSPEAQRAFDRGLTWTYAFAHHAAEDEFKRALAADPNCAMAHWGIALVNGPHINFPFVPPNRAAAAWNALANARRLAPGTTELEQALIRALEARYANPQPEDRSPLDEAYAKAMRKVWEQYPDNADVGALYAEAEMDLHPWDLWENGEPRPWTPPIVATLEKVLELNPRHPGANHYYIHAMEASGEPEKAVAAAERLLKLVPDSSHLVHMPAHIFVRVGRWADAADSNQRAMAADRLYRAAYPRPGFYALYMAHNTHFLAFTSMMRGRSEEAIRLAREMIASVPPDFVEEYSEVLDGFTVFVPKVLMRFGKWDEILAEPAPPAGMPLAKTLWHFTRTAALSSLGRLPEAEAERNLLAAAARAIPEEAAFGNNSSRDLAAIAILVADGEIAAQKNDLSTAIAKLREAAGLEDQLRYDEPPDWIQPVRHTLGAVLLRAGEPVEAEKVYREDLTKFPENGWSLLGLRDALQQQGRATEARKMDGRLAKAWAAADVRPRATCYCQEPALTAKAQ
jgi:tetratricopeptide (TPR) repeat protein